jgi:protein gp37
MGVSKIEWTDRTWNPVTGCSKLSTGCLNCYAEAMARRLQAMGVEKYRRGFEPTLHYDALCEPLKWAKPSMVFVCSMSDLFHESVPFSFIDLVMAAISQSPRHTFQLLTKRAERMAEYFMRRDPPENAWVGVTIEAPSAMGRIDALRHLYANVRFVSCEPLVGRLDFDQYLYGVVDWVIVGGESGPGARPMRPEWAESILGWAKRLEIPVFFKQWGAWGEDGVKRSKKANGGFWKGAEIKELPTPRRRTERANSPLIQEMRALAADLASRQGGQADDETEAEPAYWELADDEDAALASALAKGGESPQGE